MHEMFLNFSFMNSNIEIAKEGNRLFRQINEKKSQISQDQLYIYYNVKFVVEWIELSHHNRWHCQRFEQLKCSDGVILQWEICECDEATKRERKRKNGPKRNSDRIEDAEMTTNRQAECCHNEMSTGHGEVGKTDV